jgi:uncharacterized membrane protein
MNLAHLHIVLNHVPSIGMLVGLGLFVLSLLQKSDQLKKISLQVLLAMAFAVLPTYMSGNAAQDILRERPEVPQGLIEEHQNSALFALILTIITGTFAWFGLWQFKRFHRPGSGNSAGVLVFSAITAAIILRTANLGGDISHPEIRVGEVTVTEDVGWRILVERFSSEHAWVWPTCETIHFLGMAILFGVTLLLTLRMFGVMKSIPFQAIHRILPLGILGFVMNVVSGMIFFVSSPGMYLGNTSFGAKIVLILLAAACVIYFTTSERPWKLGPDKQAPLLAKIVAAGYMASLLGVMYFGRILPFTRY